MRIYLDNCCYNRPFDDQMQDALGPVGMVKFMQQYDTGYGDYTKEKQQQPDISLGEIDLLLKK